MRREILCRGKSLLTGEWIEGGIVPRANGQVFLAPVSSANRLVIKAADPSTVGQYTGLKDSNGVRIFEGDVVEYQNGVGGLLDAAGRVRLQEHHVGVYAHRAPHLEWSGVLFTAISKVAVVKNKTYVL